MNCGSIMRVTIRPLVTSSDSGSSIVATRATSWLTVYRMTRPAAGAPKPNRFQRPCAPMLITAATSMIVATTPSTMVSP